MPDIPEETDATLPVSADIVPFPTPPHSPIQLVSAVREVGSGGRQQKADSTAWIFSAIAAAVAIGMMAIEMFRTVR
jgi:hypothetical protein